MKRKVLDHLCDGSEIVFQEGKSQNILCVPGHLKQKLADSGNSFY